MAQQNFDLIVFDWDGTLMNSTVHITRSIQAACRDLGLPVPDGLRVKSEDATRGVPVIGLTAHAMSGDRERCLESGMDDYISKPIGAGALIELLGRYRLPVSILSL